MPAGPGKYDDICTMAREMAHAEGAIVIIINGDKGEGFAVQTTDANIARMLPALLRNIASEMDGCIEEEIQSHEKEIQQSQDGQGVIAGSNRESTFD